jgi:hypothetical protein
VTESKKTITVSLPTRGEAPHLDAVVKSYVELAEDQENLRVVVSVDEGDPAWEGGRSLKLRDHPSVILSRAAREDAIGDKWNRSISVSPADIYCVATDDNAVATRGWDARVRAGAALYADDVGVLYYGEANAVLPMCQAVTAGWAEGFVGIYPTHFPYWFIDMWLDELAMMTGRMVWVDVAIGSCGGERGKTRGLRDVRFWNQFFDLTRPLREAQADRAIDELYRDAQWMAWRLRGKGRAALRTVFEGRSQFIYAEAVEAEATRAVENPEDARYVRIKQAAEDYLSGLYRAAA